MINKYLTLFLKRSFLFILLLLSFSNLYAWEECDSVRSCLGNALTLSVNNGKGAHYVDITQTPSQKYFETAFTFELWMKPVRQAGNTQYIAGLWGPGVDKNDSWVIYINSNDSLIFEVNGPETDLRKVDNTIAKADASDLYDKWSHLSAVFNSENQTIYLYIDGVVRDSAINIQYPARRLRSITNNELPIQIGSCNALTDSKDFRTFRGQIDEVRMWARPLSPIEIYCQKDMALYGTEDSLMVYWRCNEYSDIYVLCDATGNGNFGRARSGASCMPSDRRYNNTLISNTPLSIVDTLKCDTRKTYRFTFTDTSLCGNRIWMRVRFDKAENYTIDPPNMYLDPNVPASFNVTLDADFVGTINSQLQVIPYNWCRVVYSIPMQITRVTELGYSHPELDMDTLYAGCKEKAYTDSLMTICNNSGKIGTAHQIRIDNITSQYTDVFEIIADPYPIILDPGECTDIRIRFHSRDTAANYYDTLVFSSNDKCTGAGRIPIKGSVLEVLGLFEADGKTRLDSIDFGVECVNFATTAYNYIWKNLVDQEIRIDTILVPEHFVSRSFKFPVPLIPNTGYLANYFRFYPQDKGVFNDSIVFIVSAGGCTIHRPVYVSGKGFLAEIDFWEDSVDFGTVIVGQEKTLDINITNESDENLDVSFYLRTGESFVLTGTKAFSIKPGETKQVPVTFRPIDGKEYLDELCLFERRCFTSSCIKLRGRGIIQRFDYDPLVMKTENVIGCQSKLDTLYIKNISGTTQVLSDFVLDDPSGKFSLIEPPAIPDFITLLDGRDKMFIFLYAPNQVYKDRADKAFLRFKTSDKEDWAAKLLGTSFSPKIYVSDPTDYGTIEAGDRKRDTITIENTSFVPITIDSIAVPEGFELIYPNTGYLGIVLAPRDSIQCIIDFAPDREKDFTQFLSVYSSDPCEIDESAILLGRAIIVPLEVSISILSYGFSPPCDCLEREIPLLNQSLKFPMTIDSVWIDGDGNPNSEPQYFSWYSYLSPAGQVPYDLPFWSLDTLKVRYCPRAVSVRDSVNHDAVIHIKAHGNGWAREFRTHLSGKQTLMMEPAPEIVVFPPTRVDTLSVPRHVFVTIPENSVNPDRLPVKIDSVTFQPDERVFSVSDSLGRPLPIILDSGNYLPLRLYFKPRAVRNYTARMTLHTSSPCSGIDTTVLVTGNGFAPAYGLGFEFDPLSSIPDTFRLINCDTLSVPVYSNRQIPASLVDIRCRLGYDTTKLSYIGADSEYLYDTCSKYSPNIFSSDSKTGGKDFLLKNFCAIDSLKPFFTAKFISKVLGPDSFSIYIDSIHFDTEEVILYHLIAETDSAKVIVQKPDFVILNTANFDSVQVLDCSQRDITIVNTGDVPLSIDEILKLHKDVKIIGSVPVLSDAFNPGDSIVITLEYCPRRSDSISQFIYPESNYPCYLTDSTFIEGIGYAPDLIFAVDVSTIFSIPDTIPGDLGDTITIPILFEKDFSAVIRGTEYWLQGLSFLRDMEYNPRSLMYLRSRKMINAEMLENVENGTVQLGLSKVDSLRAGVVAEIDFLVTVPDSIITLMQLDSRDFDTDSALFVNLIPDGKLSFFMSGEKCRIRTVNFGNNGFSLYQNSPNPWTDKTMISFTIPEETGVTVDLYKSNGQMVSRVYDSKQKLSPGTYTFEMNSSDLLQGAYYYIIKTNKFINAKQMILIK